MGNNANSKSGEDLVLTKHEIDYLTHSWKLVQNAGLHECGVSLMSRIIIEHKELKPLWRNKRGRSSDDAEPINPNLVIKSHGEKVFEVIKTAVDNVDNLASVCDKLVQIGYDHYKYGTRAEHLHIIAEALISTISDLKREAFDDHTHKVWNRFFSIIEYQMLIGMNKAQTEQL